MVYSVHVPSGITPAASQTDYLAKSKVTLTSMDKKHPKVTAVPYAQSNSAIESQVTLSKAPRIQSTQPDVFHYGHSLYFTRVNTTTAQNVARIIVSVRVQFF